MMSSVTHRREQRAARRAELDGSGPVREERAPVRFPGATAKFALFGEVVLIGVLITLAGLFIVTLPAALAAGMRHLRRYIAAESSPLSTFWRDLLRALPGGLGVGMGVLVLAAVLVIDITIAGVGLPGGAAIAALGWAGLGVLATALLIAAAAWVPESGWKEAVRSVPSKVRIDPVAAVYIAVAALLAGVLTWMLVPVLPAVLGCAALAAVAAPRRGGR